ncbi:MAG: hypothetical protein K0S43_3719 [Cellulosimicrobium sp.]|nr:hypothetical protein [Cellulosimicrobium sp.]
MCGATGAVMSTSGSTASRGTRSSDVRWLFSVMSFAIAVLGRMCSISTRTSAIARCTARSVAASAGSSTTVTSPVSSETTLRHSRCRNRCDPTTARVSHGRDRSSGPIDIS